MIEYDYDDDDDNEFLFKYDDQALVNFRAEHCPDLQRKCAATGPTTGITKE